MASTSLATLRRAIGRNLRQPFFTRFAAGYGTATSGSTTTLIDTTKLLQADNFWRGQYVFFPTTGEVREISASTQSTKTLTWLEPLAAGITTDQYEIWSQFTALEVNDAINRALRSAWPYLFSVQEKFLVIQLDTNTEYSLTSLSPSPRWLSQVQVERNVNSLTGTNTTTVAQNRLKDTNQTFTSEHVGWQVRIYDGTSKGDYRTVSSVVDSNTLEVSANFTTILTTTSKYRLADVGHEARNFMFETSWSVDAFTNPTKIRLGSHPYSYEGFLLRLLYEAEFDTLATEAATTTCPREFVELMAAAKIYHTRLSSAPASEIKNWGMMYETTMALATRYAMENKMQHLATTMTDDQDSLNGYDAEYPFRSL